MQAFSYRLAMILMTITPVGVSAHSIPRQAQSIAEGQAPLRREAMRSVVSTNEFEASSSAAENPPARPRTLRHVAIMDDDHQVVRDAVRWNDHDLVLGGEHIASKQIGNDVAARSRPDQDVLGRRRADVRHDQLEPGIIGLAGVDAETRSTSPELFDLSDQSGDGVQRRDKAEDEGDQLKVGGAWSQRYPVSE